MPAFVSIYHTSCLPKFSRQTLHCPSIRYIVPAKISPALPCVRKTDFVAKYDDFYPLLCSIASSWIQIGVKRISQACCLHHLKNMENNWKTQHWYEKQNRALFMDHTVVPNLTIFLKLPLSSRHHSITDKFFKTRSCPLFRGFTV